MAANNSEATDQNCSPLYDSINNLSSTKYGETEFNAVIKTLLPAHNNADKRLKYHDDIIHIKNGPFDLDVINIEISSIIEQCDVLFKNAGMSPAKKFFTLNLAFKTNRENNERELLGYGSILFEDRRIAKLLIGFGLDGEIRSELDNNVLDVEVDFTMSWADLTMEAIDRANKIVVTLLDPLVKFRSMSLYSEMATTYRRILVDTAKHDNVYRTGFEDSIIIPESYDIITSAFRIKEIDITYDHDKLICPMFPKNALISKLRSNILIFSTDQNKSHIVRENNVNYHRLYPYINNVDNRDNEPLTLVIYFDPSTQDAQKAISFIRTYYAEDKSGHTSKVYFNYRKKGINPYSHGMNMPQLGSGIHEDLESGSNADYTIKSNNKKSNTKQKGDRRNYQNNQQNNSTVFNGRRSRDNHTSAHDWRQKRKTQNGFASHPPYGANKKLNGANKKINGNIGVNKQSNHWHNSSSVFDVLEHENA